MLFTLKLLSESLHLTQTELCESTQDIVLARALKKRLALSGGAIPESRIIDVESQITRLEVSVKAYRQELLSRGFGAEAIDGVAAGQFVTEMAIVVPPAPTARSDRSQIVAGLHRNARSPLHF